MKYFIIIVVCFLFTPSFSQESNSLDDTILDDKYREDQFYFSITYNLLTTRPQDITQSGFSTGFHLGFIRDMPINERRNFAIGLGLGLSSNSYNQDMSILRNEERAIVYSDIDDTNINVTKNKFTTYLVEFPLELRWRTSTSKDYAFWRIYAGFKLGYLLYNSTKYKSENGDLKLSNLDDFDNLQCGLTMSIGYDTWNFHAYYGLNPIFNNSARFDGDAIDMRSFKLGLMFYIL